MVHVIKPLSRYEVKFVFTHDVQETDSYRYVLLLCIPDTVSRQQNSALTDALQPMECSFIYSLYIVKKRMISK